MSEQLDKMAQQIWGILSRHDYGYWNPLTEAQHEVIIQIANAVGEHESTTPIPAPNNPVPRTSKTK